MDLDVTPLSTRLAALAEAIVPGSRVADVGSDHGQLPLWLAATGRAAYCLATEKTAGLLRQVARPPADASWTTRLGYREGNGLAALRPEDRIDTIVLAGLGGRTIVSLLGAPQLTSPFLVRLVLQPRSELAGVRLCLSERGWRLVAERLTVERGRFHVTLAAERGSDADLYRHTTLSREDLLAAGPLLARSRSPELSRYWRSEWDRLASIVARPGAGPSLARARSGLSRAERILAAISTPYG
jgi:tRNA (adenine22-N1)-methyltransferase